MSNKIIFDRLICSQVLWHDTSDSGLAAGTPAGILTAGTPADTLSAGIRGGNSIRACTVPSHMTAEECGQREPACYSSPQDDGDWPFALNFILVESYTLILIIKRELKHLSACNYF